MEASATAYNYEDANIDLSKLAFTNPETISAGTTTLLTANNTLAEMAETEKNVSYQNRLIASGITMDGNILGSYASSGGSLTYTATANKATKLTFGNVEWKDSGALIDHSTTIKGKGQASLSGNDLIFTAETGTGSQTAHEQTHNTLMGMEAGMGTLTAGTESIGEAMTGLASSANTGSDGVAVYAGMGGGTARQKTGSHVDSHNWNAILAVGTKNETSKGSVEWGGFFEYGRGNFTTHSDDAGRADGTTSYTGGGLLAKWTTPQDIYVEGSFRAGRTHDTATDMLYDGLNYYGYNVHANYVGGHIGVGKIFRLDEGRNIDVYGKFFYNRRGGVSFDAGGQYDLDAVESKILRTGFKYNADLSKGWNWYAGLAYEYEFDGKSTGTADGAPIRAASIKGGSVLGEVGLHLSATETNPWEADLNLHGSCGQHRGVGGTVSVAYKF